MTAEQLLEKIKHVLANPKLPHPEDKLAYIHRLSGMPIDNISVTIST